MKYATRKAVLFSLILLSATLAASIFVYQSSRSLLVERIKSRLEERAFHVADKLDMFMRERKMDMSQASAFPVFTTSSPDSAEIEVALARLKAQNGAFTSISFISPGGKVIADTSGEYTGKIHPFSARLKEMENGEGYTVCFSPKKRSDKPILYFAQSFRNAEGRKTGTLVAEAGSAWLDEITVKILKASNLVMNAEENRLTRIDLYGRKGTVAYSNRSEAAPGGDNNDGWNEIADLAGSQSKNGGFITQSTNINGNVVTFTPLRGVAGVEDGAWTLALRYPAAGANAAAMVIAAKLAGVMALAGLFGAAVVYLFTLSVTRQVERLGEAAKSVAGGDLGVFVAVEGRGEFKELAENFNTMVQNLANLRKEEAEHALKLREEINKRKAAEAVLIQSEEQYRELYDNASDMLFTLDMDLSFTSLNKAGFAFFGYSPDETVGLGIAEVMPLEYAQVLKRNLQRKINGEAAQTRYEVELMSKNGERSLFELHAKLIYQWDEPVGIQFIARDLTERKRAEELLRAAKEKAEDATKLKDKFVSLVSHDLRSPICSVIALMKMLLQPNYISDPAAAANLATRSLSISESLISMIDRLLDLSRLQSGAIRPNPMMLNSRALVSAIIEPYLTLAEAKGISLKNELPSNVEISADYDLFKEVVKNLLANAVKFCRNGDEITVYEPEGRPGAIAVKDTGVGIHPALLKDLFRHEVKTSTSGTAGERGTGLGLPLCKDIMEAHGGALYVESHPGGGSKFFVELPEWRITEKSEMDEADRANEGIAKIAAAEIEVKTPVGARV